MISDEEERERRPTDDIHGQTFEQLVDIQRHFFVRRGQPVHERVHTRLNSGQQTLQLCSTEGRIQCRSLFLPLMSDVRGENIAVLVAQDSTGERRSTRMETRELTNEHLFDEVHVGCDVDRTEAFEETVERTVLFSPTTQLFGIRWRRPKVGQMTKQKRMERWTWQSTNAEMRPTACDQRRHEKNNEQDRHENDQEEEHRRRRRRPSTLLNCSTLKCLLSLSLSLSAR